MAAVSSGPWRYLRLFTDDDDAPTVRGIIRNIYKMLEVGARRSMTQQKHASEWADKNPLYFWTSWPVLFILADLCLAVSLEQAWVLYGSMIIIFSQILWIVFKWVLFIVDDAELWGAFAMIKGCIQIFLRESENVCKGDNIRFFIVGSCMKSAPSGIGYARAVLRERTHNMNTHHMNLEHLRGLAEDRRYAESRAKFQAEVKRLAKEGASAMAAGRRRITMKGEQEANT
jgi:hypothetical protein